MKCSSKINPLKGMAILFFMIAVPFHLFFSCSRNTKEAVALEFDRQTTYTMRMTDIEQLISDSGITKYKIISQTWLKFDKATDPYWYFPDGLYGEKFDTLFNIEAVFKADTAYYFVKRKLWEAIGNVDITNLDSSRFESSHLFWDQNKGVLHTDSLVKVTTKDFVKYGKPFIAKEDLSYFEFSNSFGEFNVELNRSKSQVDTIPPEP